MSFPTVLVVLVVWSTLNTLLLLHELGHCTAAKLCGMKVPIVSIGIARPFVTIPFIRWKETEFHLTPWLIAAYAYIPSVSDREVVAHMRRMGANVPRAKRFSILARIFVLSAGIIANVLNFFVFVSCGRDAPVTFIEEMRSPSPASTSGLRPADVILKVDGKPFPSVADLIKQIAGHYETPVELTVRRGTNTFTTSIKPDNQGSIGASFALVPFGTGATAKPMGMVDAAHAAFWVEADVVRRFIVWDDDYAFDNARSIVGIAFLLFLIVFGMVYDIENPVVMPM